MEKRITGKGKVLIESLTKEQNIYLMEVLISECDVLSHIDSIRKIDSDTAKTVEKVLRLEKNEDLEEKDMSIASESRILEEWNSLWGDWESCVFEVGDEEGKYVEQDAHWEPPYFNSYALAEDIESVAKKMLDILDKAFKLDPEPMFFSGAIKEIECNIGMYPEWMGADCGDPCVLEKYTTRCILKWAWLLCREKRTPGKILLENVFNLIKDNSMIGFDSEEIFRFFIKLPEPVCREIYSVFKENGETYNLENSYSEWHLVNHDYEERFNYDKYLETCRKHLKDNWNYGIDLIKNTVDKKNFKEAEKYLINTFSSYLRIGENNKWLPEKSLLIKGGHFNRDCRMEEISDLLEIWTDVAKDLDNLKRSAASEFQSIICKDIEDCDSVIMAYQRMVTLKEKDTIELIFSEWTDMIVERSFHVGYGNEKYTDTWIHWLVSAVINKSSGKEWFYEKMKNWFNLLIKDPERFKTESGRLILLTADIPGSKDLDRSFPHFFKTVIKKDSSGSGIQKFRKEKLKELNAGDFISDIMNIWKRQLCRIVPDPSNSYKSNYSFHAEWAKALFDIAPAEYNKLIQKWCVEHKRRRNLWRDMKNSGLIF